LTLLGRRQHSPGGGGLEAGPGRGHLPGMAKDDRRIIDMTLEGEFVSPPPPPRAPIGARILLWAIVVMVLAVTALIVALTFWFVVMILPVVLAAALIAYLAIRYQMWRTGRSFTVWRGPRR
jgi:hypothetical protein